MPEYLTFLMTQGPPFGPWLNRPSPNSANLQADLPIRNLDYPHCPHNTPVNFVLMNRPTWQRSIPLSSPISQFLFSFFSLLSFDQTAYHYWFLPALFSSDGKFIFWVRDPILFRSISPVKDSNTVSNFLSLISKFPVLIPVTNMSNSLTWSSSFPLLM